MAPVRVALGGSADRSARGKLAGEVVSWSDPDAPVPLFFGRPSPRLFGVLHPGAAGAGLGVVICTSIGNEAALAARSLRRLADELAAAGLPTLRFDPPSTGDSAGSDDAAERIHDWRESIGWAVAELRSRTGVAAVALVGVRLGATIAISAVDAGLEPAGLVLWDPPPTGARWLRDERAYHRLTLQLSPAAPSAGNAGDPLVASTVEELGGFGLDAATRSDVEAIDVLETSAVWPAGLPVLLDASKRARADLARSLGERGAAVEEQTLPGLAGMLEEPGRSVPPIEAIRVVRDWLAHLAEALPPVAPVARGDASPPGLLSDGSIVEEPFLLDGSEGRLFNLISRPADGAETTWAVLLNAGFVSHVGPNRMYVRWARAWAARGRPSLRVDSRRIGESDGLADLPGDVASLYTPDALGETIATANALRERRGAERLTLIGLCSGAYMAFHVALQLPGVRSIVMINPQILSYDREDTALNQTLWLRRNLRSPSRWRVLLARKGAGDKLRQAVKALVAAVTTRVVTAGGRKDEDWLVAALARLAASGVGVHIVMSEGDPGLDYLQRHLGPDLERAPAGSVDLHVVPAADHTFRPLVAQARLTAIVDSVVMGPERPGESTAGSQR